MILLVGFTLHNAMAWHYPLPFCASTGSNCLKCFQTTIIDMNLPKSYILFNISCISCSLQELFSEVGDIKQYPINYDKSGRPKVGF